MIIQELNLLNFGVYGGEKTFQLEPKPCNGFTRPVILVRGKNGSGKTTLMEAIRLCLHGSFVLGTRVSRRSYENYLAERIHVPPKWEDRPSAASVGLRLRYVDGVYERTYDIEREWHVVDGNLREYVHILEDGKELEELRTRREKDSFLRELILPGVADLFFFDAERLHSLADRNKRNELLAETVKALLGLNLVDQLQDDLDIYLARQQSGKSNALKEKLDRVIHEQELLRERRHKLLGEKKSTSDEISSLQRAIVMQEQEIASQGSWFSSRLEELKLQRERLQAQMDAEINLAQDMTGGLLPFAITPQLCLAVADRLEFEAKYEKKLAAQEVLRSQLKILSERFRSAAFWQDIESEISEDTQEKLLSKVIAVLKNGSESTEVEAPDIILRLSRQDRSMLLNWIRRSTTEIPKLFNQRIKRIEGLESQLAKVEQELQLVPADETLRPLVEELHRLSRKLSGLQQRKEELSERIESLDYNVEQKQYERARLREQIVEQEHQNRRLQLAHKSQLALADYSQKLSQEKVALVEERLITHFNELCRKEDTLVSRAKIDPRTFEIDLYRQSQVAEFNQLSAGERQILALAIMWALREVSGLPMPIMIDTPFGRLDSVHRQNVIQKFLPRISHQVILLTTDMEVDEFALERLDSVLSRIYHLEWNATDGKTTLYETASACDPMMEKVGVV